MCLSLHAQVAVGSGDIHELNISTFKKVSTIRSEVFETDPRAGKITAQTNAMRLSLIPVPDAATVMVTNRQKTRLIVGEASGALQMWRLKGCEPLQAFKVRRFQGHMRAVVNITCSPSSEGALWVTVGGEGAVRIWSKSGACLQSWGPRYARQCSHTPIAPLHARHTLR